MERLGLDTIKVGFVYNIVLCRKSVIGADRSWDRANGQDLLKNFDSKWNLRVKTESNIKY